MTEIHICDKCSQNLNRIRWNFFQVEEVPHYAIPKNEKVCFELCDKCIKKYTKMVTRWVNEDD